MVSASNMAALFRTAPKLRIINKMVERTRGPIIAVADHTKWGMVSNFEVASIDQIDFLITDDGFDLEAKNALTDQSVEVFIASSSFDSEDKE